MLLLDRADHDPLFRTALTEQSRRDIEAWVSAWVWTYDPRKTPSTLPFVLFPRQVQYLRWLEERWQGKEDGLAEKCRDVGFTWLSVVFLVHKWLYVPGFKGSIGSRKEALVDKLGDLDSIFEKARFILRMLPRWMLPRGFSWKVHDNYMRLVNPETGATLTGEAGDNMGRGGRSSIYFVDEAAFIERPQKVDAALSQNTDVKIYVSTPNGRGNPFADKRFSGNYPVFTFRWQDDPRKGQEWYDEQRKKLDPVVLAQEVDIDYSASITGIVVPAEWVQASRQREAPDVSGFGLQVGVDVARYGNDKSALVVRQGRVILSRYTRQWSGHDLVTSAGFVAEVVRELRGLERGEPSIHVDGVGVGAGVVDVLRSQGFQVVDVQAGSSAPSPGADEPPCNLKRDWLWWRARQFFREEDATITTDGDRSLLEALSTELSSPTYGFTSSGKIKVEGKDEMRKRGVASPNLADALIHTFEFDTYHAEKKRDGWRERSRSGSDWMTK